MLAALKLKLIIVLRALYIVSYLSGPLTSFHLRKITPHFGLPRSIVILFGNSMYENIKLLSKLVQAKIRSILLKNVTLIVTDILNCEFLYRINDS